MKFHLYILIVTVCILLDACEANNVKKNAETVLPVTRVELKVPIKYKSVSDSGFHFQQDTLYYQGNYYSGYAFKLYPNNDTVFIGSYLNGLEQGPQKKWYVNNQLAETRLYEKGKKAGVHIGYWEDGKIKFEYHFLKGEQHGVVKEWYKNGKPYKIFHYENGYESGSQKMWWENGVIRANYVVKNGRRYGLIGLKLCMNQNDLVKPVTK
jgi:antitoxin component YwqK of YwqJK toxin-antitoxin module